MKELSFTYNSFKELASTHLYLLYKTKQNRNLSPQIVIANNQTKSIGSRDNEWISLAGNLFFSLNFNISHLPNDLKLESSSIYFAMIMKMTLSDLGSKVTIKWPNDFYLEDKKIGGIICTIISHQIIISMGINTNKYPNKYNKLDIKISPLDLLKLFILKLKNNYLWKNIFNEFRIEFGINKNKSFHYKNKKYILKNTILCNDGSIMINNIKVYSTR